MRSKTVMVAAIAILLLCTVALLFNREPQGPTYNGRSLRHWTLLANEGDQQATAVLAKIEPKDIPYLVAWLPYEGPSWRAPLYHRVIKMKPSAIFEPLAIWIGRRQREDLARGAMAGLMALGTNAAPALQQLTTMMNNFAAAPTTSQRATRVLATLGTNALPALVETGRDPTNPAHVSAASAAFDIMCRTVVDPQFTNKLRDSWARPWFSD